MKERMTRHEVEAVKLLFAALSNERYAQDELGDRLMKIPDGPERLKSHVEGLRKIMDEMTDTFTIEQCKAIYGTMKDYEMRLVPKLTPATTNVLMTRDQAKELMDCARVKCSECVEDGITCKDCQIYRLMESVVPLDHYGNGMICPYSLAEWSE